MARLAMRAVGSEGSRTPTEHAKEAATQTFKIGALLEVSGTAGQLQEAGADSAALVGLSLSAGQNGTAGAKTVTYVPVKAGVMFEASVDDSGSLGNGAIQVTDLLSEFGVTKDAAGIWFIDKDETSNSADGRFRILRFKDAVGTVNGRVLGQFTYDATVYADT